MSVFDWLIELSLELFKVQLRTPADKDHYDFNI